MHMHLNNNSIQQHRGQHGNHRVIFTGNGGGGNDSYIYLRNVTADSDMKVDVDDSPLDVFDDEMRQIRVREVLK